MGEETNLDIWGEPTDNPEEAVTEEDTTLDVNETSNNQIDSSDEKPQDAPEERLYTIKVNGEEHQLNETDLIATAQKGADYDRIRQERDDYKESLSDISKLAKDAGMTVKEYLAEVSKGIEEQKINEIAQTYIQRGIDEDIATELAKKDVDLERLKSNEDAIINQQNLDNQLNDIISKDWDRLESMTGEKRTAELEKALEPYFQKGYLIIEAYQQLQIDNQKIELQNEKNRLRSTGSVRGSSVDKDDDIRNALLDA